MFHVKHVCNAEILTLTKLSASRMCICWTWNIYDILYFYDFEGFYNFKYFYDIVTRNIDFIFNEILLLCFT